MQDSSSHGRQSATSKSRRNDVLEFVPSISTYDIFRQLIVEEIRSGRLTPARRRRIVRYAAQLGLSAVQAGRLIAVCREEVIRDSGPTQRDHALRLVEPRPGRVPTPLKIALVVAGAIALDLLVIHWLW